eukprot:121122-Prorocentrum_minimum.AAC.2
MEVRRRFSFRCSGALCKPATTSAGFPEMLPVRPGAGPKIARGRIKTTKTTRMFLRNDDCSRLTLALARRQNAADATTPNSALNTQRKDTRRQGQRVQGVQRAKMVRRLLTGSAPRRGANSLISPAAHAAVASEAVKGGSRLPPVEATESIRD